MTSTDWAVLGIVNIPIYFLLGWVVFGDWETFGECIRYALTPDIISWFRGEGLEDFWAEMRLFFWVGACALVVWGESHLVMKYILHQVG